MLGPLLTSTVTFAKAAVLASQQHSANTSVRCIVAGTANLMCPKRGLVFQIVVWLDTRTSSWCCMPFALRNSH
jgi:hypothetical protein